MEAPSEHDGFLILQAQVVLEPCNATAQPVHRTLAKARTVERKYVYVILRPNRLRYTRLIYLRPPRIGIGSSSLAYIHSTSHGQIEHEYASRILKVHTILDISLVNR
jgi:hypothetical protein